MRFSLSKIITNMKLWWQPDAEYMKISMQLATKLDQHYGNTNYAFVVKESHDAMDRFVAECRILGMTEDEIDDKLMSYCATNITMMYGSDEARQNIHLFQPDNRPIPNNREIKKIFEQYLYTCRRLGLVPAFHE